MDAAALANEWLRLDQDEASRAQIQDLVRAGNHEELARRMTPRISFGTAGLRAKVEAGFARMNGLVVLQTSQGLAQHLIDTVPGAKAAGVVVGYDGRRDSRRFAELAAAAIQAKGVRVVWYDEPVHTPLVPFGVRTTGAAGGVMVTASHNPKDDNGYKVYAASGCQINGPDDALIAAAILANLEPLAWEAPPLPDARPDMARRYAAAVAGVATLTAPPFFVYTPMHGVGARYFDMALQEAARGAKPAYQVVVEQAAPDPEFPTVKYPNPEEDGALDLAKATADRCGARLIVANDPDADRLAVAEKTAAGWVQFKGDDVGALLGSYVHEKRRREAPHLPPPVMLCSAVSSQRLGALGDALGFEVEETLTGFKWLGNRARQRGDSAVYAYEEALGYMLPAVVHDKDGVAAAMLLLEAAEAWGSSLAERLEELSRRHGYFETANTYWKSPGVAITKGVFDAIRADPHALAAHLAGFDVSRVRDLVAGTDSGAEGGRAALPSSPENLMLTLWLAGADPGARSARCSIRASGTEPKLKVYVECAGSGREGARRGALAVLRAVRQAWFTDSRLEMEARYETETRAG